MMSERWIVTQTSYDPMTGNSSLTVSSTLEVDVEEESG